MYIGNANCNIQSLEHIFFMVEFSEEEEEFFFHFVRQDSNLTLIIQQT